MSLAKQRERRSNAGSRMAAILDKEEDDFYKTTYGGFFEEENDNEYSTEASESDDVDSDFDIDENDELISEDEDEDGNHTRRAKGRVVTKAYQEPAKPKAVKKKVTAKRLRKDEEKEDEKRQEKRMQDKHDSSDSSSLVVGKKSVRESTKLKTEETELRRKLAVEEQQMRKKPKNKDTYRQLTQEELLKEAKHTEELNLKSLERYQKLELEKSKKSKLVKEGIKGPIIRYQSISMPLIEETSDANTKSCEKRCSRNFITFSDEETFNSIFKMSVKPPPKKPTICPISHLKARYFDPVTQLPFISTHTFRALREAYYKQLEHLGDMKQPDVKKWIEWRKRNSAQTPNTK
ncbi:vacuolar protein sorting-associated protein 72-like protein [Dinothrombium tinctorium]|uniref:Vacuolar protein sorting-associated protein 72 homolog n=1 Tax=Dinothrombium tinctorium TaxID=1965070 RepID=A0A3S3Q115_9ACAR|nr:vacuolar protein sorting-associated protein 72-like protein [Dinothrombium tinctorium]RWS11894.1 vacuolar protein sorting-associated protein 72-like protein [Dinothrombium tinctorium]